MNKQLLSKELFFSKTADYLDIFIVKQCNYSQKTSASYRDGLTIFKRYVESRGYTITTYRFMDCTYDFLLDYKIYLKEELKYQPASINQRIAAVKSYVRYCASRDISVSKTYISISAVPLSKVPKRQLPIMKEEALSIMFNEPKKNRKGLRDMLIMSVLYDTAIRLDELIQLTVGDVYIRDNEAYFIIHGKGNKERKVSMDDKTYMLLNAYMNEFHKEKQLERPLIYTVIKGETKPMSHRNVQLLIKKYGEEAKKDNAEVPEPAHPHLLRRSRATGLYQNGIPLEMISRFLGHSSTETTKNHYAFASLEQMRDAMEKAAQPRNTPEEPMWKGHEDELSKLCGLRK